MRTIKWIAVLALATVLAVSTSVANEKWLHVRVEDDGGKGERVNINVPLSLVERMLPLITVDELRGGKLMLDELDEDLEGIDLRELAAALRDAPDADFVTVESDDEKVRVAKEGRFLIVRVEEHGKRSADTVRVRIPLSVVDALVGDDPNELDLVAALRELAEYDEDPLIDVQSDDATVQVWIDADETGR